MSDIKEHENESSPATKGMKETGSEADHSQRTLSRFAPVAKLSNKSFASLHIQNSHVIKEVPEQEESPAIIKEPEQK